MQVNDLPNALWGIIHLVIMAWKLRGVHPGWDHLYWHYLLSLTPNAMMVVEEMHLHHHGSPETQADDLATTRGVHHAVCDEHHG